MSQALRILLTIAARIFGDNLPGSLLPWIFMILGVVCLAISLSLYRYFRLTKDPGGRPWAGILVGIVLIGVGLAIWLVPDVRTPEARALAAIKDRGGQVFVVEDVQKQPTLRVSFREPGRWRSRLNDRDLADLRPHFEALPHLRHLDLTQTFVTENGLAELEGLTNLKTLSLGWCENDFRRAEGPSFPNSRAANALTARSVDKLRRALPHTNISFCGPALPDVLPSPEALKRLNAVKGR
jgi:hypothetical protein